MKFDEFKVKLKIDDIITKSQSEFETFKEKQKGEITTKDLVLMLLNELNFNQIDELVVIRKEKITGQLVTGWTTTNLAEGLGMAEILKFHMLDSSE